VSAGDGRAIDGANADGAGANGAGAAFDRCVARLHDELARIVDDVAAATVAAPAPVTAALRHARADLAAAIDAAHALALQLPKAPAKDLRSLLWGIEDSCALAQGFMCALAQAGADDAALNFEVADRKSGRTVAVALPLASHAFGPEETRARPQAVPQENAPALTLRRPPRRRAGPRKLRRLHGGARIEPVSEPRLD
jgi:hypothetical protein